MVSEIGLGGEWLERHNEEEVREVILKCEELGINILDCWMSEPNVRTNIGKAIKGRRDHWIIEGHVGAVWENGQYVRTRNMKKVIPAFEDLMERLGTDYLDLGMIHYIDDPEEFTRVVNGEFMEYMRELKRSGRIRHIGMSTHNPATAKMAAMQGEIEMILFSINPAFDLLPANDDLNRYFDESTYEGQFNGIDPVRTELYRLCEQRGIGINVMKGYAGGRLFRPETSPFGVALTPVQCLHYALTRPAVASVMAGFETPEHVIEAVSYETATAEEKDYASVLANAPRHAMSGQCTYCGHCAPCPSGIDIAMVNKLYDLAVMQEEVPASVRSHYHALKATATDCIACGGCEKRCPFGVPVIERMKKTKELFG